MFSLQGKTALVTGASRGIGAAIAETLAKAGAKVIGTATSSAGADKISGELVQWGGLGIVLNITDRDNVETTLAQLLQEIGPISVLVNNAGVTRDNLFLRMKEEEWDEVINTNLKGVYYVTHTLLRSMLKIKNGRIINISSLVGATGNKGQCNYAASKAGLVGFSQSLAREVASRQLTVNCVAPGWIATDMTNHFSEEQKAASRAAIPLERMGSPKDVAATVLFLASDEANYITGQVLHVNGGLWMNS